MYHPLEPWSLADVVEHHARIKSIALQALRWGKVESLPHAQNDKTVSYGAMNWRL